MDKIKWPFSFKTCFKTGSFSLGKPLMLYFLASKSTTKSMEMKYKIAGIVAAKAISEYGIPVISAIINAPAPNTGGNNCPPSEATASIAAAT